MTGDWLNPSLNAAALRRSYSHRLRISIPHILREERATELRRTLESKVPWTLTYLDQGRPFGIAPDAWSALPESRRAEFLRHIDGVAGRGFQFLYLYHSVSNAWQDNEPLDPCLRSFYEFLNTESFMGFIKAVTGNRDGNWIDLQAACYGPGHFLNKHNDAQEPTRRIAYVFNLTPLWRADWGGSLCFQEQDGSIADTVVPAFNTLSLFSVPTLHFVSQVATYAGGRRLSLTGWLHARP